MAFFKRTQKQIAQRLRGNLDYYNRRHFLLTWRWWISALALLGGAATVPAFYYYKGPEALMNPGPISRGHASIANNCAACHPNTSMIRTDTHQAGKIVRAEYFVPIDQACMQCHPGYAFHQPNVAPDLTRPAGTGARNETSSCTSCHKEHLTAGKMLPSSDQNCAACHNRADLMAASAEIGHAVPSRDFPSAMPHNTGGLRVFYKPRPPEGYTEVFAAFDQGHPGFQIQTKHLKDPDTLQYNHARHERADIPNTEMGTRLACDYCHKADATGTNFQKITFENNCVHCHALAFDPNLGATVNKPGSDPGLVIPHGDPEKVRGFLRTLPNQYLEYAIRQGSNSVQAQAYMISAVNKLADSYGVPANALYQLGPKLEQKVFYNADHLSTGSGALRRRTEGGGGRGQDNTYFPGCAFCHQVSAPVPNVAPKITPAVIFDRWLGDGRFDHSKHQQQTCAECHSSIHTSERTSDINIPTQQSCTQCHNSKPGGVANDCESCHHYHDGPGRRTINKFSVPAPNAVDPTLTAAVRSHPTTLREMLLAKESSH